MSDTGRLCIFVRMAFPDMTAKEELLTLNMKRRLSSGFQKPYRAKSKVACSFRISADLGLRRLRPLSCCCPQSLLLKIPCFRGAERAESNQLNDDQRQNHDQDDQCHISPQSSSDMIWSISRSSCESCRCKERGSLTVHATDRVPVATLMCYLFQEDAEVASLTSEAATLCT